MQKHISLQNTCLHAYAMCACCSKYFFLLFTSFNIRWKKKDIL